MAHLNYDLITGVRSLAVEVIVVDTVTCLTGFEKRVGYQAETCNQVGKIINARVTTLVLDGMQGIKGSKVVKVVVKEVKK